MLNPPPPHVSRNPLKRVTEVLFVSPIQFVSASMAFFVGLWLLLPGNTFAAGAAYELLERLVHEELLGAVLFVIGILQFAGVTKPWKQVARWSSLAAVFIWSLITYSFWVSNLMSLGSVIYPHIVVLNAVIFIRLSER